MAGESQVRQASEQITCNSIGSRESVTKSRRTLEMQTRRETEWESLLPELLTLVVRKVQKVPGDGGRAVAVAGVCRAWRRCVHQEWHRQPPSLLTFPASVRLPPPCGSHNRCLLENCGNGIFVLYQVESRHKYFILCAKTQLYSIAAEYPRGYVNQYWDITMRTKRPTRLRCWEDNEEERLTSNLEETVFTLPDNSRPKSKSKTILLLQRDQEVGDGDYHSRRMHCEKFRLAEKGWTWPLWLTAMLECNPLLNFTNHVNHSSESLKNSAAVSFSQSTDIVEKLKSSSGNETMLSLRSRKPEWGGQDQRCWELDCSGNVRAPLRDVIVGSPHNLQLVSRDGRVILQVAKLGETSRIEPNGSYVLDFSAPLSALEAFAISVSTFCKFKASNWSFKKSDRDEES